MTQDRKRKLATATSGRPNTEPDAAAIFMHIRHNSWA
jgi:hypothetical protein